MVQGQVFLKGGEGGWHFNKSQQTNLKYSYLYNQIMPRLPGCLFKSIQKQPPDTRGVHSRQLASLSDWWCGVQEN